MSYYSFIKFSFLLFFSHSKKKKRLLRFEEKNLMRQEIENLHEKVDVEENRTSQLEEEVRKLETDGVVNRQRLSDLNKEQEIGLRTYYFSFSCIHLHNVPFICSIFYSILRDREK